MRTDFLLKDTAFRARRLRVCVPTRTFSARARNIQDRPETTEIQPARAFRFLSVKGIRDSFGRVPSRRSERAFRELSGKTADSRVQSTSILELIDRASPSGSTNISSVADESDALSLRRSDTY